MEIEPLDNRVVVITGRNRDKHNGLYLAADSPDTVPNNGIVAAIAPGVTISINVGDRVFFQNPVGQPVQMEDGQGRILVPESDLLYVDNEAEA